MFKFKCKPWFMGFQIYSVQEDMSKGAGEWWSYGVSLNLQVSSRSQLLVLGGSTLLLGLSNEVLDAIYPNTQLSVHSSQIRSKMNTHKSSSSLHIQHNMSKRVEPRQ